MLCKQSCAWLFLPLIFSHLPVNAQDSTRFIPRMWHVNLIYAWPTVQMESVQREYQNSGYPYIEKGTTPAILGVHIEKAISKRLRGGMVFYSSQYTVLSASNWRQALWTVPRDRMSAEERLSTYLTGLSVDYLPVLPKNFRESRFEFGIGAGVAIVSGRVSGRQSYIFIFNGRAYNDTSANFKKTAFVPAAMLSMHLDLYLTKALSIQWRLESILAPSLQIPSQTYTYQTMQHTLATHTLAKHRLQLTRYLNFLSCRLHF